MQLLLFEMKAMLQAEFSKQNLLQTEQMEKKKQAAL